MQGTPMQTALGRQVSSGGRFTWTGLAAMIVSAPLVGLTFARVGEVVQSYLAPSSLVPVLMGVFIGLTIVAITRFGRFGHRSTIFSATVAAAVVAAVGYETALGGTGAVGATGSASACLDATLAKPVAPLAKPVAPPAKPVAPNESTYQFPLGRPLQIDAFFALLAAAAAVMVTIPAVRVPYCDRCGSWFRTIRNGKIDLPTSRRLAELLDVDRPDRVRSPRYRLSACQGDCGPTRCELSWERSGGGVDLARVWLDDKQRSEVVAILDELNLNECEAASGRNNAKPQAADPLIPNP